MQFSDSNSGRESDAGYDLRNIIYMSGRKNENSERGYNRT